MAAEQTQPNGGRLGAAMDAAGANVSSREAERLYRLLVEQLTDLSVFVTDPDGRITTWNPGVERVFGYTQDEFVGEHASIIFTRDDIETGQPELEMQRARTDGRSPDVRWHVRKDGSRLFADGILTALYDDNGSLIGFSKIVRDITERKVHEQAVAQLHAELTNILESISDGFIALDGEFRYTYVNAAAERLFGARREERLGRVLWDVYPEAAGTVVEQQYRRAVLNRVPVTFEDYNARSDRWFEVTAYPAPNGGLTALLRDVTDRRRLRNERERLRAALDAANAFLRSADGTIEWWSSGAARLYGWSAEEAVGRRTHELLRTECPRGLPHLEAELRQRGEWSGELAHYRRDGTRIFVASHWVLQQLGTSSFVTEVNNDITPLKQTEELLSRANGALRRSNEELEQFAYAISHDLQAPLRAVTGYADLLAKRYRDRLDTDGREFLGFLRSAAEHMGQLIRDLLAYSQVASAEHTTVELVDADALLKAVIRSLHLDIEDAGAVITSSNLPSIRAERLELMQLFSNLLSNALKYRNVSVPSVIRVSAERTQDGWVFSVRDNGVGIDPAYHERIFGIFKRLHGPEYAGTGIGLAICQKIIERNGGRIWVESAVGAGATFFFTWRA
jgi:PAS domain S-box-containing protein